MADLIDRQEVCEVLARFAPENYTELVEMLIGKLPAVDAVEVATLEKWLYEIAMNNIGAPVEDMAAACEIIISRLGGLRKFAEERREEDGRHN